MNDDGLQTIASLQEEIGAMQCVVLTLENRITRKLIAIEEIVQGRACKEAGPIRVTPQHAAPIAPVPPIKPPRTEPSVGQMVDMLLAEGAKPDLNNLRQLCLARWPELSEKIRNSIWSTCRHRIMYGKKITLPLPRKQRGLNGANRALTA